MKTSLFLFVLIALPCLVKSQKLILPIDSTTHQITYNEVVKSEGVTKDELYVKAREWFAKTAGSAQDVIQMDDKAAGKIIGKGATKGSYSFLLTKFQFTLRYTVSITTKDNRYRYDISDFQAFDDGAKTGYDLSAVATSKDYKNKKGEYRDEVKGYLTLANQVGLTIAESIKKALSQTATTGGKSKDDF